MSEHEAWAQGYNTGRIEALLNLEAGPSVRSENPYPAPPPEGVCAGCIRQGEVIIADLLCPRHGIHGTNPEEAS